MRKGNLQHTFKVLSENTRSVHMFPLHPVAVDGPFVKRTEEDLIAFLKRHKENVSKSGVLEWVRYRTVGLLPHGETFKKALASGLLVGNTIAEQEEDYHQIMASVGNWDLGLQAGREEWQRYLEVALLPHGETFELALASDLLVGVDDDEKKEDYKQIMESVGNWSLRTGRNGM